MSSSSGCAAALKKKTIFFNEAKTILQSFKYKVKGNVLNSGKYGIVFNTNIPKHVLKISKIQNHFHLLVIIHLLLNHNEVLMEDN